MPTGGRRHNERQALSQLPLREAVGGFLREAQRSPCQLVQGVHDLLQPSGKRNRLPKGGVEEARQETPSGPGRGREPASSADRSSSPGKRGQIYLLSRPELMEEKGTDLFIEPF